jgi:RNA recognition motif-containing protein
MFNRETNKSRGFGFVIFHSESSVDAVCEVLEHRIDDKVVRVVHIVNMIFIYLFYISLRSLNLNQYICIYSCLG